MQHTHSPDAAHCGWLKAGALRSGFGLVAGLGALALLAQAGLAQDAAPAAAPAAAAPENPMTEMAANMASLNVAMDTMWVLVAAFLVFFMQAGFAYVEGGLTRAKNQNNILMKNLLDFSFGTISFFVVGFAIMFGKGNPFMGTSGFLMGGADNSPAIGDAYAGVYDSIAWAGVPLDAKFLFQLVFAATAATIVSGAMAERTKFSAYLIYSVVISAVIYPISGHWIWGGGWLAKLGFWDFAGSTVVHSVGAWVALVGAAMLGPRIGKYGADGTPRAIPGHSIPMAGLGVFILWLGWFGFNPGSTMAMSGSAFSNVAHIAVTTNAAAATGGIFAMLTVWAMTKKPDASMTLNGVLGGLVAITAPCPWVSIPSAIAIGAIAGVLVVLASFAIERTKTDDPVGAVAVHGACGAFGTLSVGLFASAKYGADGTAGPLPGLFAGGGVTQLLIQAIGVGAVFAWCIVCGVILFSLVKAINGLRVSAEEEIEGLDIHEHGGTAYGNFALIETHAPGVNGAGHVAAVRETEAPRL